jgi:hypothetical protein
MPGRSQVRMIRITRCAGRGQVVRPGSEGEIHSSRPSGSVVTNCTFTPCLSAVLGGEVGPAVAYPVALSERAVEQNVVRIGLTQHLEQARCMFRQQADHRGGAGRQAPS